MAGYNNSKPQEPNSFVVFDFETGGLDSNKNPATEIALIVIDGGVGLEEICRYQELIKPYDYDLEYTEKAIKVSGVTIELVEDEGKDINEVVEKVIGVFQAANLHNPKNSPGLRPVLVGHNPMFDINFLQHIFERYALSQSVGNKKKAALRGQDILESLIKGNRDHFGNFYPEYINTWSLGKMWFGGDGELPNYQLGTIVEKAGVELSDAHRAMNDTIATADFLRATIRNLRSGYGLGEGSNSFRAKREGFQFPI